jgi:hypothetical protein
MSKKPRATNFKTIKDIKPEHPMSHALFIHTTNDQKSKFKKEIWLMNLKSIFYLLKADQV